MRLGFRDRARIDAEVLWEYGADRARGRHAHGFTFLTDWAGAGPLLPDSEASALSDLIVELFSAWEERFGDERITAPEMAFHDETTAQRMLGLVSVLDSLTFTNAQRETLTDLAHRTAALLAEPDFYGGVNNHGMFQDLAILAWAVLIAPADDPARTSAWDLAAQRLRDYFSSCFTSEGVHIENTPTYHVMVARYLPLLAELFTNADSPDAELYRQLHAGAARFAVHCVTPETLYPPVSDTHRRRLDTPINLETFTGGEFEYAATGGARGERPRECTAVFPASGYAMTRSDWGDPDATYVHFTSAYNADYHKHSDEGSVYLRSGSRDLLCEAGPYGYNWKDPFTKHAYSSAAHNTLIVDGTGTPRTEPELHVGDGATPWNELELVEARDDALDVIGTTRRYRGRLWKRHLRVDHGERAVDTVVRIDDTVESQVGTGNLRFVWHIGPGLTVRLRSDGAEIFDGASKVMEIEFRTAAEISLQLLEGVEEPSIQGWHFPDFGEKAPAPAIQLETRAADVAITTEVRLSGFLWDEDRRDAFETLMLNTRSVPTWSSTGLEESAGRSVLFLSPYRGTADRERLLSELTKAGTAVCYVPGVPDRIAHAGSVEGAEAAVEQFATAAIRHIEQESERGVQVTVATADAAFGPAAIAALHTGSPLIALDPQLPFRARDPRADRLAARLEELAAEHAGAATEMILSSDHPAQVDRVIEAIGATVSRRSDLRALLKADVEDAFSGIVLNSVNARAGEALLCTAVYDRRMGEFIVDLPQLTEVEVSVRVFQGKEQVHLMPYSPGATHRIRYRGKGPHRLRVHVRETQDGEAAAFTTGTVRVR
ncbi:MAG: heparinase II/III family protein [Brachybacterium sp.]